MTFTTGRGNELCVAGIEALRHLVVGKTLESITENLGEFWASLVDDGQLRWVGPEKGVIHMATAALVNAVWDLYAKTEGKPLWKLLADMTPEEVVRCIPFRYITDALTPREASGDSEPQRHGAGGEGIAGSHRGDSGIYDIDRMARLLRREDQADVSDRGGRAAGSISSSKSGAISMRMCVVPGSCGRRLVPTALSCWMPTRSGMSTRPSPGCINWLRFHPLWIEEPTSPDDILGHARIAEAMAPLGIGVATGEHCHNRVMFKQLFQSDAISFAQVDACRLGGVNEALAVLLMAAKFDVAVCPHAGGVGLCEYVQHLAIFDYLAVSGSTDGRVVEYVDHLHEHFVDPAVVRDGHYLAPTAPGTSITMHASSISAYSYPLGAEWSGALVEGA